MSELEQKLREYVRVNDSYCPCTPQEIKAFRAGADLLLPMLVEALSALEICANRKECETYECCASCGPIYEAEEAIESINEKIKSLASEYE